MIASINVINADYDNPVHQQAIIDLLNSYAHDPTGNDKKLSEQVCKDLIPGLRDHPAMLVFLAFREDQPVGLATCLISYSTFNARPVLNIHDLVVAPDCRGQGIGSSLMDHIENAARGMNCHKVTLEVSESNHGARKLYREVGYGLTPDGNEKEAVYFLEKYL
jgi:ribosomal protein S18 acetylase RimI-like enzyme